MLLQDKKGLSVMIGYVLLVVIVIAMSGIIYQFIKNYIPKDIPKCPDEVSVFITKTEYDCDTDELKVITKNTGLFSVAGYFIHATTEEGQELATEDLSVKSEIPEKNINGAIIFAESVNSAEPDSSQEITFIGVENLENRKIELIPVRWQDEEGKSRFVSCGGAKVEEVLSCEPAACVPDDIATTCGTRECGTVFNNCDDPVNCPPDDCVGTYGAGYVCDATGTCIDQASCTDDCDTYGYECGTWTICGVSTDCPDTCDPITEGCNILGKCELLCGNGEIDDGEECDDGGTIGGDGCNSNCEFESCGDGMITTTNPNGNYETVGITIPEECDDGNSNNWDGCTLCTIDAGWNCENDPLPSSCERIVGFYGVDEYCIDLGVGYTSGACVFNNGGCNNQGGELVAEGDAYCEPNKACCIPAQS